MIKLLKKTKDDYDDDDGNKNFHGYLSSILWMKWKIGRLDNWRKNEKDDQKIITIEYEFCFF